MDESEEVEAGIADEDGGIGATDDMWDNVEVDSEFEDLSEDDIYADMEGDIEEKADGDVVETPHAQTTASRHHRGHHHPSSHGNQEATQPMIDAVSSYMAKKPQNGGSQQEAEFSDEEEAAYATQVERYTQFSHINETHRASVAMDVDSDDTEDEDEDTTLTRPARARRTRPEPEKPSAPQKRATKAVAPREPKHTPARTRERVKEPVSDEDVHGANSPMALRERKQVRAPQTAEDLDKIRTIVAQEFQTAIESKKKELAQIEANLVETRRIWERLQLTWANRVYDEGRIEARVQAVDQLRNSKKRGRPMKREKFTTAAQMKEEQESLSLHAEKIATESLEPPKKRRRGEALEPRPLYCLTAHKGFVQVICPDCNRVLFGNHLGFINHCRIMHLVKFATWEDAVGLCGQPVDESVVPLDDPCRTEGAALIGFRITQQQNEIRNTEIRNTATSSSAISSSAPTTTSHLLHSPPQKKQITPGVVIDHLHPENASNQNALNPPSPPSAVASRFYIKKQLILGNSSKALSQAERAQDDPIVRLIRPTADSAPSHRWMVYLRPIGEDLANYISKVRFFLHPSFKPRHIVEVTQPPFQLVRESSHEWPVRVQIFFNDPRNKAMSFVHYIVFKSASVEAIGEEYLIDVEINRDFTHNMILDDNISIITTTPSVPLSGVYGRDQQKYKQHLDYRSDTDGGGYGSDHVSGSRRYLRTHDPLTSPQHGQESNQITFDKLVEFTRHACETLCPIISKDVHQSLPYSFAKSIAEWTSWTHGKRHSIEWQRALRLSRILYDTHRVRRTTREMLDLCRHLNLTPIVDIRGIHAQNSGGTEPLIPGDPNSPFITPLSSYQRHYNLPMLRARVEKLETAELQHVLKLIRFCRFCGCVHLPFDKIDELELVCGERKLLILQETHSTFRELLERSIKQVKEENQKLKKRLAIDTLVVAGQTASSSATSNTVQRLPITNGTSASPAATPTKNLPHAKQTARPNFTPVTPGATPTAKKTQTPAQAKTPAKASAPTPPKVTTPATPKARGRPPKSSVGSPLTSDAAIPTYLLQQQKLAAPPVATPPKPLKDETPIDVYELTPELLATMDPTSFMDVLRRIPSADLYKLPPLPQNLLDVLPTFLKSRGTPNGASHTLPVASASMDVDAVPSLAHTQVASSSTSSAHADPFKLTGPRTMIGKWNVAQQDILLEHFRHHPEAMEQDSRLPESVLAALYKADSDNQAVHVKQPKVPPMEMPTPKPRARAAPPPAHPPPPAIMDPTSQELVHPQHGTMGFKSLPPPTLEEVPALRAELGRLQLEHDTDPTADLLLIKLMGSFARRLLFSTTAAYMDEKAHDIEIESEYKVVVPLHVVTAVVRDPLQYDFLLDEGLARYTSLEMIEANALAEDPAADSVIAQLEPRLKTHRAMVAADAKSQAQQPAASTTLDTQQSQQQAVHDSQPTAQGMNAEEAKPKEPHSDLK